MSAEHDASAHDAAHDDAPPGLGESLRQLHQAGHAGLTALLDAGRALRALVAADLALARRALWLGSAFLLLAVILIGSGWLLAMAALAALLQTTGLSWLAAFAVAALINLACGLLFCWVALRYFRHTRLQASRRQLTHLVNTATSRHEPTTGAGADAT